MIPSFDMSGVLPPYMAGGNPTNSTDMSPYLSDIAELATTFSTSRERIILLRGLIGYRAALSQLGIGPGFQWIDGSFVEAIELTANRHPGDIDVITFFRRPALHRGNAEWGRFFTVNQQMFSPRYIKATFACDAYPVDLDLETEAIVNHTRYWFGLFSHKKISNQWKGMVQIDLNPALDSTALAVLEEKEANL